MKISLLSFLSVFAMATSAMASPIDHSTETHSFDRWPDQMESIVADHEGALNQYLGKTLECRRVKLQFNNLRSPTLFKTGKYNLTLTAECNKSFRDFNMDVTYGYSLGEPIALHLSYNLSGRLVKITFQGND